MLRPSTEPVPSGRRRTRATARTLLLGVLLALGLPGAAGAPDIQGGGNSTEAAVKAGMSSDSAQREAYRQAVLAVKQRFHVPGVVAGVWVPGKRPWKIAEGVGNVAHNTPIHVDDHFPIRSVTKSYTVTLILQLVRTRAISLEDP